MSRVKAQKQVRVRYTRANDAAYSNPARDAVRDVVGAEQPRSVRRTGASTGPERIGFWLMAGPRQN